MAQPPRRIVHVAVMYENGEVEDWTTGTGSCHVYQNFTPFNDRDTTPPPHEWTEVRVHFKVLAGPVEPIGPSPTTDDHHDHVHVTPSTLGRTTVEQDLQADQDKRRRQTVEEIAARNAHLTRPNNPADPKD